MGSASRRAAADPPQVRAFEGELWGRGAELAAVLGLFERGERLVTIVGPPGIGKTRLAAHAAVAIRAALDVRTGDLHACDLTGAHDALEACRAMAAALDVSLGEDAAAHVGRVLARRPASLFVLDGFERLASSGPETVGAWLAAAPQARFLVTSREALRLSLERVVSLGPLALPEGQGDVWTSESGRLFAERARAARPDFAAGDADAPVVFDILSRLEGIPLAIELAAGQMGRQDPARILAAVRRSRTALASELRDAPPRHATLHAAIDASWQSLSPEERRALACVTVFRGGFTLDAAEAVLDAGGAPVAPSIGALHDKSLLQVRRLHPTLPSRFTMYEAVRELAAPRAEPADLERAASRHAAWCLGHCEAIVDTLDTSAAAAAVRTLLAEADNLAAVHERALAADPPRPEAALRAALVLDRALAFRGPAALPLGLLDGALAAAGEETSPLLRARALTARARVRRSCGPLGRARADLDAALALAAEPGAAGAPPSAEQRARAVAEVRHALGMLACDMGDRAEAARHLEQALDLARAAGAEGTVGAVLNGLGTLARIDGRAGDAEGHYQHAISVHRAAGNRRGALHALSNLASLLSDLDRDDVAEEHARVLAQAEDLASTQIAGQAHASIGVWLQRRGRLVEARAATEKALTVFRNIGDQRLTASVLANLGTVLHEMGDRQGALASFEEGLSLARALGARHAEVTFLAMAGGALAALDLEGRARATLDEAERHPYAATDPLLREMVALLRAHADLAAARRALAEGDADRAALAREAAARRIDAAEGRSFGIETRPALVDLWTDALLNVRILRRRMEADPKIEAPRHDVVLDARAGELRYRGGCQSLNRRPVVRTILYALAEAAGQPLSKEALCERAFGHAYRSERDDNPLRVSVNRLRALLEPAGLKVEFTGGYRLAAPAGFLYLRAP